MAQSWTSAHFEKEPPASVLAAILTTHVHFSGKMVAGYVGSTDWLIISLSITRINALLTGMSLSIVTALNYWTGWASPIRFKTVEKQGLAIFYIYILESATLIMFGNIIFPRIIILIIIWYGAYIFFQNKLKLENDVSTVGLPWLHRNALTQRPPFLNRIVLI